MRRVPLALLALAFASASHAQFGGWSWTTQGCAFDSGAHLFLQTCASGCGDDARVFTVAPDSGIVSLDYAWLTQHGGGNHFTLTVTTLPSVDITTVASQGGTWTSSWCLPQAPPCSGGGSVSFPVKLGQKVMARLDAVSTENCASWDPGSVPTQVTLSNWSFVPETLPVLLQSVHAYAWSANNVTLTGDNFDASTTVAIDGVNAPIVSQTPTSLVIRPGVDTPGFKTLAITNSAGSAQFAGALARLPTLAVNVQQTSATKAQVGCAMHVGATGTCTVGATLASLSSPLGLGPSIYYGLLLDLTPGLLFVRSDAVSGIATKGFVVVPYTLDPSLTGVSIALQGLVTNSVESTTSFTNLAVATLL